ncbi:MAG: hypothetical protein ACON5A_04685 [Candidatus Comchoanobacterales bacterium]
MRHNTSIQPSFSTTSLTHQIVICSILMIAATCIRVGDPIPMTLQTLALAWISMKHGPKVALIATVSSLLAFPFFRPSLPVYLGMLAAIPIWSKAQGKPLHLSFFWLSLGLIPVFSVVTYLIGFNMVLFTLICFDLLKMFFLAVSESSRDSLK